ncbi:MAG: HAMP domain-containing histidine kinase [Chloroflexota bacterium]|nr:HAMP domain-containing histidine kinase [Chloroflexota bacterium]
MFTTLRSKLIFSYGAIAVLSLLLAMLVALFPAREYAINVGFENLKEKKAVILTLVQLGTAEQKRLTLRKQNDAASRLHEAIRTALVNSGLRVLLVDPNTLLVKEDFLPGMPTVAGAQGQHFSFDIADPRVAARLSGAGIQGTILFQGEKARYQYVAQRVRPVVAQAAATETAGSGTGGGTGTLLSQQDPVIVVLAQPEPRISDLVGRVQRFVLPTVLIALLVSLSVAFFLARSVSRPVARLAEAAGAMAQGDYSRRLPVEGHGELATLTGRFNEMASEVGRAHTMERDFIANVSHDLKTPLTSVQGFSQAMLDGTIKDEAGYKQAASIINIEAQQMSRLVNQLLDLSTLQGGLKKLALHPVELHRVFAQLVLAMQPQADAAGVRLSAHFDSSPAQVLADVDHLKQAFGNLIDNAIKHTPTGGSVTIEMNNTSAGLRVAVRDTGKGIPPEDLPRVMERFYQVDKSRRATGVRSVGLGLAITREIVAAHGGDIQVESTVGAGTTVTVTLPDQRSESTQRTGVLSRITPAGKRNGTHPEPAPTTRGTL